MSYATCSYGGCRQNRLPNRVTMGELEFCKNSIILPNDLLYSTSFKCCYYPLTYVFSGIVFPQITLMESDMADRFQASKASSKILISQQKLIDAFLAQQKLFIKHNLTEIEKKR